MKIRNGFVSNSSSSSFIVLLPDNFDFMSFIDIESIIQKSHSDTDVESVKKAMESFIKRRSYYGDSDEMYILETILRPYIIATIETGPDEDRIVLVDNEKVKKILNIL